jgi:hypothetical protein
LGYTLVSFLFFRILILECVARYKLNLDITIAFNICDKNGHKRADLDDKCAVHDHYRERLQIKRVYGAVTGIELIQEVKAVSM